MDSIGGTVASSTPFQPESLEENRLENFIKARETRRVGRYFESLTEYWLDSIRGVELLAVGKQIRLPGKQSGKLTSKGKSKTGVRTVGELDFIYREKENVTHLETTVKFYLHFEPENPSGSHFVGPNANDHLEKKINRLRDHQLPLSREFFPEVDRREALVRGRIFYHPFQKPPSVLPEMLAAEHLRENWIYSHESEWFENNDDSHRYRILQKPHWLADEVAHPGDTFLLSLPNLQEKLSSHFVDDGHPLLISILRPAANMYQESSRVFVVPRTWPQFNQR